MMLSSAAVASSAEPSASGARANVLFNTPRNEDVFEVSGDYIYYQSNNEAMITKYTGSVSGALVIPSTLDGFPVTSTNGTGFSTRP